MSQSFSSQSRSIQSRSNQPQGNDPSQRSGFFLVLVLVVIVIASMAAYSFTGLMLAYDETAYLSGDLVQARVATESGAEVIRRILADAPELRRESGGVYNNPNLFQAIVVSSGADGVSPCNVSVPAPDLDEYGMFGGLRFGLQNESARLNVNALTILEENSGGFTAALALAADADPDVDADNIAVSLLLGLPNMTEEIADAILDWLDEDDEPREFGAESDYYVELNTKYEPANGPLQSVEELLLVRGVTPTLLFGADANRNGLLDPDEQQRFSVGIDTPGALGWAQYITIHGSEASKRNDGGLQVNVNNDDLELVFEQVSDALGDELFASFIVAYRIAGQSTAAAATAAAAGNANGNTNVQSGGEWSADLLDSLDLSGGGDVKLNQVLDLVDATVTVGNGNNARSYNSPFRGDPISAALYLPLLLDAITTHDAAAMPGRININECPAELLYGIPLLEVEQVEQILETREIGSEDPNRQYETWMMTEGILSLEQMRQLVPLVTCGGDVYRAQIVGYFENAGASHRSEVIIDATTVNPKIVSWRDLSHLGRGFDLSVLGLRSAVDASTQ